MLKLTAPIFILTLLIFSCKKEKSVQPPIVGQWIWTIDYSNNPLYNSTPQTTGINETLEVTGNGTFSLIQNTTIINSGTYKLSSFENISGDIISTILYSNSRVTDSIGYYKLNNTNDSLFFSFDLAGSLGSVQRHYGRR